MTISTHRSIIAQGGSPEGFGLRPKDSLGPCCKMFFPFNEGSGNRVTDLVGGVGLDLAGTDWSAVTNAVKGTFGNLAGAPNYMKAPDAGNVTSLSIGTKDFIWVANLNLPLIRGVSNFIVGSEHGAGARIFSSDTESITVGEDATNTISAQTTDGIANGAIMTALIRQNHTIKLWHDYDNMTTLTVGNVKNGLGGIYHQHAYSNMMEDGQVIPVDDVSINGTEVWASENFCSSASAPTNCWESYMKIEKVLNVVLTENKMMLSTPGIPANVTPAWHGLALYVFNGGLPSDYKQALRWMRRKWESGRKVSWPGWMNLE